MCSRLVIHIPVMESMRKAPQACLDLAKWFPFGLRMACATQQNPMLRSVPTHSTSNLSAVGRK